MTCCKSLRWVIKVVISAVVFLDQKRLNTLNHRYMETTTKQLVSVRKLHKHRRSRLSSFFETQILPPLRHRLPRWGFKSCDITTNFQIISIENDYLMHEEFKNTNCTYICSSSTSVDHVFLRLSFFRSRATLCELETEILNCAT